MVLVNVNQVRGQLAIDWVHTLMCQSGGVAAACLHAGLRLAPSLMWRPSTILLNRDAFPHYCTSRTWQKRAKKCGCGVVASLQNISRSTANATQTTYENGTADPKMIRVEL